MKPLAILAALASLLLVGCGSSASTNKDAADAAASIDASKRGVVAQPDTDLTVGAPGGVGRKPGGK